MCHWKNIGPEWKTEDVFQVREILRGEQIPFKMPFSDIFFVNEFHRPSEDKRWTVMVREKDWEKVVRMLIREDLIRGAELEICAVGAAPEPERTVPLGVPVPSR